MSDTDVESLPLSQAAAMLLDECRMVLPGLQALLGFQLTVVFSGGFASSLTQSGRQLHLAAIVLVAIAVGLIMTPAAYHRETATTHVTRAFIRLSSRLLLASMFPLALGISLDVYLVAGVIAPNGLPGLVAGSLLSFFLVMWFVLPRVSLAGQISQSGKRRDL